jgi:serine/threonine protein kinase
VALKVLPREFGDDPTAVARFRREVEILKRCEHPNVISTLGLARTSTALFTTPWSSSPGARSVSSTDS